MFGRMKCLLEHDWSPEDYNKEVRENGHEIGEEIYIRCHRCKKVMAGIEKLHKGAIKWTAYDKGAIMYDVNPEYLKKEGLQHKIEKFREDNK